jgi:SGNH domain (fused to AT3 domains)
MNPLAMATGPQRWRHARWAGLLFVIGAGSAIVLALALGGGHEGAAPRVVGVTVASEVRTDARDAGASPLDMLDATLVQQDVRMVLRVSFAAGWKAADLTAQPGRAVCLMLARAVPATANGRLCMTAEQGHPRLTYTPLGRDGSAGTTRQVGATVQRPRRSTLEATFLPVAAGLEIGPYSWWLQTDWTDPSTCARTCTDRLPDAGAEPAQIALLGVVPCFGAAARDRAKPCRNPELRLAVEPPPQRAAETLDPFCDTRVKRPVSVCAFGASPDAATATFALIGDSHVAAMKTALEVLTLAKRWRGLSMVLPACPATKAVPILPTRARSRDCATFNRNVLTWLAAHPGVQTAFLSTHTTSEVKPEEGKTMAETARAGYRDEIAALLRVVERVVVIRDTPFDPPGHLRCIQRAVAAGRSPGPACARSRRLALTPDPLAAAARDMRSGRVRLVDLTSHVCNARRCFPVVGGALVHRDETHVTPAFSATLGPFILRALER